MAKRRLRRAGAPWRVLAHTPGGGSHDLTVGGSEFDELVVGRWLHIEQMASGRWWMDIGGVTVHVKADRDGKPLEVRVDGPLDYNAPVEGCAYDVVWTDVRDAAGQESPGA